MECMRVQVIASKEPASESTIEVVKYIGVATALMLIFDIFFMAYLFFRYILKLKIFGNLILSFYALSFTLVTCELTEMGFRIFCNQTYNRLQEGKNSDYLPFRFETVI